MEKWTGSFDFVLHVVLLRLCIHHILNNMKELTWDVGILAVLGIVLAYSLLIRKHTSLAALVSVYIAYVMTSLWGDQVVQFFSGQRVAFNVWIQANSSPYLIRAILFGVLIILLTAFIKLGGKRSRYSMPEVALYSISAVMLATVLLATLMPADYQHVVLGQSKIMAFMFNWRQVILGLPVFLIILFGIYGNEDA